MFNSAEFTQGFTIMLGVIAAVVVASLLVGVFKKVA